VTRIGSASVLVVALLALTASACHRRPDRRSAGAPSDPADSLAVALPEGSRGIAVAPVERAELADYLDIPAHIQADPTRVVLIYAPVSGRLLTVDVRPEDVVQPGQVLATLASSDLAAALAAYRQAQADARVKQQELERSRALYEHNVIALRDYQQAQADAQSAAAALAGARERLELLDADPDSSSDRLAVRAPRAGVVTDVSAAPGQFAKSLDKSTPLCTIADLSSVWAVGDVYERDLATIHVGQRAVVTAAAYSDEPRSGTVAAISSVLDTTTRTLKVRVVLANPGTRLKPDMFAMIRVVRAIRRAVLVPEAAVLREGLTAYVYVQRSPGHFARRAVILGGDTDRRQVEVTSGLSPGDTVVIEGVELLRAAAGPS